MCFFPGIFVKNQRCCGWVEPRFPSLEPASEQPVSEEAGWPGSLEVAQPGQEVRQLPGWALLTLRAAHTPAGPLVPWGAE